MVAAADVVQVQTTVGTRADGERIARTLVDARLVACAQLLGPITSTYRWRGVVETADEWLVLLKTPLARYERLEAELRRLHPYEEPEIVALPIVAGSVGYLGWVHAETETG